jgi:hypothetical protein
MLNGVNTILAEISDGGYLSGKWYDVEITHIMVLNIYCIKK